MSNPVSLEIGIPGIQGAPGVGVPAGGTTGQALVKSSDDDFDTNWVTLSGGGGGSVAWADITGKPSTFPPATHSHAIADVTGLQTALDGKQAAGSYAAAVHGHAISHVTGLQTALDGKAASSHTHSASQISDSTAAGRTLLTAADAAAQRAALTVETTTQLNARDTANRARANHTGTQTAATISDFSTAADARITASDKVSSNTTGITGADQVTNIVSLTQAEYDAIGSPSASTLYVIV